MEELYSPEQILVCLQTPFQSISKAKPDEESEKETEILLSHIEAERNNNEINARLEAFEKLRSLVQEWIKDIVHKEKGHSSETYGGDLYAFGSFALKVALNDADIDTICIVPKFFTRDGHFFGNLFEKLKTADGLFEVHKITEAFIPLIRLKHHHISVDILFAALNLDKVPKPINFKDDSLLLNLDEKCYRSLNGIRCAVIMETIVPSVENFRKTLICVKFWAKQKGIYSSLLGYFSGVSLAIMVAKICQLYPNYNAAKLLERFFFIFSVWRWDHICVKVNVQRTDFEDPKLLIEQFTEASEKNYMNIITPAFPSINASHLVSATTFKIMTAKLKEAHIFINAVRKKKRSWAQFFEPYDFFRKFHHLLEINIYSADKEEFVIWRGSVESKLRKLTKILESFSESQHLEFYPSPISYKNIYPHFENSVTYYFGIKIKEISMEQAIKVDFRPSAMYFMEVLGNPPSEQSKVGIRCTTRYSLPNSVYSPKDIKFSKDEGSFLEFGNDFKEFGKEKDIGKENFNRNSI